MEIPIKFVAFVDDFCFVVHCSVLVALMLIKLGQNILTVKMKDVNWNPHSRKEEPLP